MINGKFYFNNNGLLEFIQNGQTFDLANTSTGLKSIGILQLLLENRKLKENTYLIMDEPEVHLHPEWQVKLAHILVLLVKELNVNLFINSHSPQFIEAMEVYTIKYGLRNEINFYLSKKDENNEKYNIEKIEYDKLYELYNNLGDPYDIVDEVRGENLANRLQVMKMNTTKKIIECLDDQFNEYKQPVTILSKTDENDFIIDDTLNDPFIHRMN